MIKHSWVEQLDRRVSEWVPSVWGRWLTFDALMIVIAKWTPFVMLGLIGMASFMLFLPHGMAFVLTKAIVSAVLAAILARGINEPVSRLVDRPRPFEAFGARPLLDHAPGKAFPSNHATGAFALSISLIHIPGYGVILLCLAVLVSTSRIYTGLHHLTDVLAGIVLGTLTALVMTAIVKLYLW